MTESFWDRGTWGELAQGDLLPGCLVPVIPDDFGPGTADIDAATTDLIIVTQSCDLANNKVPFVALCPIFGLAEYEVANPAFRGKGAWESVRKGRQEGLHMLGGRERPGDNREALVVDFRQVHSLPAGYLLRHAEELGER